MRNKIFVFNLSFLILISLDQITKLFFSTRDFFVGPVHLHLVKNYGLSFALNFGTLVNISLVILGLGFFVYYYFLHRDEFEKSRQIIFVLIFAGAISNIIDRLYLGFVRDFIDLNLGFTFNLADAYVVIGLLLILFTQSKRRDIMSI